MEVKKVLSGYRRGVLSCVQEAEQIASRQIQLMARDCNLEAHG